MESIKSSAFVQYILKKCLPFDISQKIVFCTPWKLIFDCLEGRWPADGRFWSVQEAFLEGPTWLREAFEALQSASKHQSDVTNLCFGSILFKRRFFNDVSHENPIFVLSCRLQEAFESPPGGIGKPSKRFEALLNTYKMSHTCGLAVYC